jgi:hypothetical protein
MVRYVPYMGAAPDFFRGGGRGGVKYIAFRGGGATVGEMTVFAPD